jgi:hypothetical protein
MAEGRENNAGWALTGVTALAGLFGAVTFTDSYQAMSFLVLILTAISLIVRIRKDTRDRDDE